MALTVEVVYPPEVAVVELSDGATLRDAVVRSGMLGRHPEIQLERQKFGVFGKLASPQTVLKDGDRVEIYRPLAMDPKEARRRRAAAGRRKGSRV
jgi:uncharacterized protein